MTDNLRLEAELAIEKFTKSAQDMIARLKEVGKAAKGSHDTGVSSAKLQERAYADLTRQIDRTRNNITGSFIPAMAALGITTFTVGEALAKMVEALRNAGQQYQILNDATKRTRLPVDTIRALSIAFERFGISQERSVAAANAFSETMDKLRRRSPSELNRWANTLGGAFEALGATLMKLPTRAAQLDAVMNFFSSHPDIPIDQKRQFYEELLRLPPELATKTGEELRAALDAGFKYVQEHPSNMKAWSDLDKAFSDLRESINGFGDDMVDIFGSKGVSLINKFADSLKRISDEMRWWSDFLSKWSDKLGISAWVSRPAFDPKATQHNTAAEDFLSRMSGGALGSMNPRLKADQKETTYEGTLRALQEWWAIARGGPGSGETSGAGTGTLFRPGVRSGFRGGQGASRGNRNNNRGNLKYGDFAKAHGATGADDRGFAIFPDQATGDAAQAALLGTEGYQGLTLNQFAQRYAEGSKSWASTVGEALGIGPNDIVNTKDPRLLGAIRRAEGTAGTGGTRANFMYGQFGAPGQNQESVTTAGGHQFTVNAAAKAAMKGFVEELEKRGAPITSIGGYSRRTIAGTNTWSQHAYGNAIDIDQQSRGVVNKAFGDWVKTHQGEYGSALDRWGIKSGEDFGDFGHYEWGGKPTGDLLKNGKRSGLMGDQTLKGDASLRIDLNGFPRGTRTELAYGGLFKDVTLNRGRQMEKASEIS